MQRVARKHGVRKRRWFQRAYGMIDVMGPTCDTPKYPMVLANGTFRRPVGRRAFRRAAAARLPEDIFDLTLEEISAVNKDPSCDLRAAVWRVLPFYGKLEHVGSFPHFIDSRGRVGQATQPQADPNVYTGLDISRGTAAGGVKVLRLPREKPVKRGEVLGAYTTDPG